jgi:FtsP/CotA-like multicopper oxidase with cupredoxin domain
VHFPDAGIYWYHPHVREDTQQDLGLYGNMLVRPTSPGYFAPVNREQVLMLDDLLVGDGDLTPHGAEAPTHALMGRFGNVMLVNGEPRYALSVRRGEVVRFYLTNASNARLFNVSFAGARMKVVASDVGKFERETLVSSVVIAPAERYVVDVEFARAGRVALVNRVQALDHMFGIYTPETDTLGVVSVADALVVPRYAAQFAELRQNADVESEIAPFRRLFDAPPAHSLVLSMRTQGLPAVVSNMLMGVNAPVEWNDGMAMMNWVATAKEVSWVLRDPDTRKENMDIDWRFRVGDVVKLRVFNDPASSHAMDHPLHLHGQRFLVVSRDGVRATNLAWKDTAIIPAGETVDLLVDMANPGRWMIHCHIAEHLGAGMTGVFAVDPR